MTCRHITRHLYPRIGVPRIFIDSLANVAVPLLETSGCDGRIQQWGHQLRIICLL